MLKAYLQCFLLSLLCSVTMLHAQYQVNPQNLLFSHLTTKDGLSHDVVNCIFQDSRGFIWIGTNAGLDCYDGNSIKAYHHRQNDAASLADETVYKIAEDKQHNLWIVTYGGVSELNLGSGAIISYSHNSANKNSLSADEVRDVLVTKSGRVLLATTACLDEFDTKHEIFVHHYNNRETDREAREWSNNIGRIYEDSHSRIWLATHRWFYRYSLKTDSFYRYTCPANTGGNAWIDNLVNAFYEDHTGQLWLGTWGGGLKKFNSENNTFETFLWERNPLIPSASNIVGSISETKDRLGNYHLWVTTANGLGDFDREKKEWSFYQNEVQNVNTISSNYVIFAYAGAANLLWLATGNGVNILDPNKQFFVTHKFDKNVFGPMAKNFGQVNCILPEGNVNWVTTWYGNGVYKMDSTFNVITKWHTVPPTLNMPDNFQVSCITRDSNFLWISTFNGLTRLDEKTNAFKTYLPAANTAVDFPTAHVIRMFIDSRGKHWVVFYHKGFSWFNTQNGVFRRAGEMADGNYINYEVHDMLEDNAGNIWLALNNGILVYNYKSNSYQTINYPTLLPRSSVNCLLKDHAGKIWVGTNGGVSIIDPVTMHRQFITRADGLSNDNIVAMREDKQHRVWMATSNGLDMYNATTGTVRIFTRDDGLESNDMNVEMQVTPAGNFLIGGSAYITEFNPADLGYNSARPPVVITGFKIFGKDVSLPQNAGGDKAITISYRQNEFSFNFAVLNYTNSSANSFYAFMDGFDKEWRKLEKGEVSYTNLDPGQYTLHVKGANNDGVMNNDGDSVKVCIIPPYWKTWWFKISATLFIAAFIALFVSYRISLIRKEAERQTEFNRQIAETRMQALRAQMNPHFIFNSLNSIQECVVTGKTEEASMYLSKFSKLVRMILENSSRERIMLSAEIAYLKLYLEVESLRFSKDFAYAIDCGTQIETDLITIPPMLIQPYIENALWHGLAHKTGQKRLRLTFNEMNDKLICIVEDNGIGREAAKAFKQDSHQSVAMKNTAERLRLSGSNAHVEIIDLPAHAGTRVILSIPI